MGSMHDKLDEIVQCVIKHRDLPDMGLMDGRCGVSLLIYYYAKNVNPKMIGLANNYIHDLFEGLRNTVMPTGYAEGVAGVVETITHLMKQRLCSSIKIEREIIEFLMSETKKEFEADNFDFFYGSAGLLYSMLLLFEYDGSQKNLLQEAVMALSLSSITENTSITNNEVNNFETGFPHGYASWVVILSKLIKHNVAAKNCKVIVKKIVEVYIQWLNMIGTNENDSLFPTSIDLQTPKVIHSRLGWCNGDYPCLYSLLYYAHVVNDLSLQARLEPLVSKLLSKLIKHNVAAKNCKVIVKKIVEVYIQWLNMIGTNENDSLFPTSIDLQTPKVIHSRLGWCNGDYPCLYSLLYYAHVVNDLSLQARLEPLVSKLLSRRELIPNSVLDAGFCHGASGIATIINRLSLMYQHDQSYSDDLLFWSDTLMRYSNNDTPETAGFLKMYYKGDVIICEKSYGFLEGLSGIGLTLIALLYKEQAWDELFLLS